MDLNLRDLANVFDKSLANSFQISHSLCLGESVLTTGIPLKGLAGYWTFDRLYPLDESGNGNHFYTPPVAGPPSNGHGASLAFNSDSSYRIRATDSLSLEAFTLSFRVYLTGDYSSRFRNLLSRNDFSLQSPSVLLYPYNNRLSVRVFTSSGDVEGLASNGAIPPRRWTHVAIACGREAVRIYVNGMLDNSIGLRGSLSRGSGDLVMGRALKYEGFEGFVDDLRIYSYALGAHELPALVSDSLTGFDTSFRVQLGCDFCAHAVASANGFCPSGFRLCTLDQLYVSAAHTARANGWLHASNKIWHRDLKSAPDEPRAALCCS